MKIKKLCTYENIQLENADGTRPKGSWARLQKTFTAEHFDMDLLPGVGVSLQSKEEEHPGLFVIPFANIPYLVTEPDDAKTAKADRSPVRRRSRRSSEVPAAPAEESEDSLPEWD